MKITHLEIMVEDLSMEFFLRGLLPTLLGHSPSFTIYPHQGKEDLLSKLPDRLRGYANWLPEDSVVLVLLDRDREDCHILKKRLEELAEMAGLVTRTMAQGKPWQVGHRIAIEELEAWYFGDWEAVRQLYPRVDANLGKKASFRDPDAIAGGTWEALERIMQKAGYFRSGLRKIELARKMGQIMDPQRNLSPSFQCLRDLLTEFHNPHSSQSR